MPIGQLSDLPLPCKQVPAMKCVLSIDIYDREENKCCPLLKNPVTTAPDASSSMFAAHDYLMLVLFCKVPETKSDCISQ